MSDIRRMGTSPRMSMGVVRGGAVYLSGQVAPDSPGASATVQTREVLGRIDALLKESGSGRERILSATIWLTDMADYDAMNAAWDAWLPAGCAPARATVGAALALSGLCVEIGVVAALG